MIAYRMLLLAWCGHLSLAAQLHPVSSSRSEVEVDPGGELNLAVDAEYEDRLGDDDDYVNDDSFSRSSNAAAHAHLTATRNFATFGLTPRTHSLASMLTFCYFIETKFLGKCLLLR